jgi:lysozyme
MQISDEAVDFIKSFEGFSNEAYICPAGYKTIGYGHLIKDIEDIDKITNEEALELLRQDIGRAEFTVNRLTKVYLNQNQFDMLVSFTYNLGGGAYQRSSLRSKVNREEHELVPFEFGKWIYANGEVLLGLVKRRKLEAEIYSC